MDQLTLMVIATFLRRKTPFVSLVEGGYVALHEALESRGKIDTSLVHHDPHFCMSCRDRNPPRFHRDLEGSRQPHSSTTDTVHQSNLSDAKPGLLAKVSTALFRSSNTAGNLSVPSNNQSSSSSPSSTRDRGSAPESRRPKSSFKFRQTATDKPPVSEKSANAAYRNTNHVFSLEDDIENEDVGEDVVSLIDDLFEEPDADGSRDNRNASTVGSPSTPGRLSWIKRLSVSSPLTSTRVLPPGVDVPVREGGLDTCHPGDFIDVTRWSSRPEVHFVANCRLITVNGRLGSVGSLVLTDRHLLTCRNYEPNTSAKKVISSIGSALQSALKTISNTAEASAAPATTSATAEVTHAVVHRVAPLHSITRITSNKKIPECITFHYSQSENRGPSDSAVVVSTVERERVYLPEAGDAVKMIKLAVYNRTIG